MLITIVLGAFVGLLLGLTGAGGGILAVPLLVYFLHLPVTEATPIGLLAVAAAASIGAIAGLRSGLVRYRAAGLMALVGVIFAPPGIWLAHKIDNHILIILFSVILLYVAFKIFRNSGSGLINKPRSSMPHCNLNSQSGRFIWTSRCSLSVMLAGTIAGFLSGLVGVGGGFVIVPALQRLSSLTIHSVVATSLAVIALVSISVVAGSLAMGNMNWPVALPFSLGAISGMFLGRLVTEKLQAKYVKYGFASLSVIVAMMMLSKVYL